MSELLQRIDPRPQGKHPEFPMAPNPNNHINISPKQAGK